MDFTTFLTEIDYLSFIWAALKWGFLFFLLGIGFVIFFHKKGLFKRKHKVAQWLSKLYYPAIPLLFIFIGIQTGLVVNTHNEFNKIADQYKSDISEYTADLLIDLNSNIDIEYLEKYSISDGVDYMAEEYARDYLEQKEIITTDDDGGFFSKIYKRITEKIEYHFLKEIVEMKIVEESAGLLGVDKNIMKKVYDTSLDDLLRKGTVVDILKKQIDQVFWGFYISSLILFLIFIGFPVLEFYVSKKFKY